MKKALITGITGQDGSYLAEFLLKKGYEVHGIKRRASLFNTDRIDHLFQDPHEKKLRFVLHYGDMTDTSSLLRVLQIVKPDEIYNLAAQSHVAVSFQEPEYTANVDALGNLDAKRDWGHARDFVEMMWLMLQKPKPADYVAATGRQNSVREFVEAASSELGFDLVWKGKGAKERGVDRKTGQTIVELDPRYLRPTEVDTLLGDAKKARKELGWKPKVSFDALVREMAREDLAVAERESLVKKAGYFTAPRAAD